MDSSIRKKISDKIAMLACFGKFLGYPRCHLIRDREPSIANGYLTVYLIQKISSKDVSVEDVSTWAESTGGSFACAICVDAKLSGTSSL